MKEAVSLEKETRESTISNEGSTSYADNEEVKNLSQELISDNLDAYVILSKGDSVQTK